MKICLLAFVTALLLNGCSSVKPQSPPPTPVDWRAKMQDLSKVLTDLLPFVADSKRFNDPANAAKIEKDTADLKALAHELKVGQMPNSDPSMKVVSSLFDDDLSRALAGLRGGNRDYSRRVLSDTTSYCIQCHTQTNNGPEFPLLKMDLQVKDLKPLDRAEFLAATRQFEPALTAYRQALSEPELARKDSYAYESAAREALAISVRVHSNAKEAESIVKAVLKNRAISPAFRKTASAWQKSINDWRREKAPKMKKSDDPTLKELTYAEELISKAGSAPPLDDSQEVTYYRAAGLLHDVLQRPNRSDELSARALYLSGVVAEATRNTNFWDMHETYYEQCIRLKPLTEQARQCDDRLSDAVKMDFSGSAGTNIPENVQTRLNELHDLAYGKGTPAE